MHNWDKSRTNEILWEGRRIPMIGDFSTVANTEHFNTSRPREDGRHFPDDIFKCIFLNENVYVSIKI